MEKEQSAHMQSLKNANNPWERVIDNCDFTQGGQLPDQKDTARMRHAMIGRKTDITKSGGMKSAL